MGLVGVSEDIIEASLEALGGLHGVCIDEEMTLTTDSTQMDTDERPDLRRGGEPKFVLKVETEQIIGFYTFAILNEIGHGLNEKIYENALTVLFKQKRDCV